MTKLLLSTTFLFILYAVINSGPIPDEFIELAANVRAICINATGASVDMIERASAGDFVSEDVLKCYLKCALEQTQLMNKRGLNYPLFLSLTPSRLKPAAKKGIEQCQNTTGKPGDLCDLAYNVAKCFYNATPNEFFIM